jgi:ribosomal protein S24E
MRPLQNDMKAIFGKSETIGFAKIYSSDKDAMAIERKHILVRNKLMKDESVKKEKKSGEKKPEGEK